MTSIWTLLSLCALLVPQVLAQPCLDNFTKGMPNFVLDLDASVQTGAAFLGSPDLQSGKQCIEACCKKAGCNLALVQRAPGAPPDMVTSCFLINCVYEQEFVCKFVRKEGFVNYVTQDVYDSYVAQREHAEGEDQPPIARAGPDLKVQPSRSVTLSGIESWDKEGIEHYQWSLVEGDQSVALAYPDDKPDSIEVSNLNVGEYVFKLIVTDTSQQHSSATVTVTVLSEEQTAEHCHASKKIGRCRGSFTRWWYNPETGECETFTFGGCKANKNNYLHREECDLACNTMAGPPGPVGRRLQPVCDGHCLPSQFQCTDGCCIEAGLECDEVPDCSDHSDELTCENYDKGFTKLQTLDVPNNKARCVDLPDTGNCRASMSRWYYDPEKVSCMSFTFGGCGGNENNFATQNECEQFCHGVTGSGQVAIAVFLGICILVVLAVIGYCYMKRRKSSTSRTRQPTNNGSAMSTAEDTEHLVYNMTTKPV
ncbi:kunitz-type protease inhibitor 1 isoform 2-T2 [Discoglossus pictus]